MVFVLDFSDESVYPEIDVGEDQMNHTEPDKWSMLLDVNLNQADNVITALTVRLEMIYFNTMACLNRKKVCRVTKMNFHINIQPKRSLFKHSTFENKLA